VYEIGYAIEDPFQGTLRLSILCDGVRRDVLGDENIRNSAFVLDHLSEEETDFDEDEEEANGDPTSVNSSPTNNVEDVYQ